MRFICFGVGAIGTYIGGSLALAGHKVVFIERPSVAEEVRQRGIHVDPGKTAALPEPGRILDPHVVDSLSAALQHGPFDAAILAVKSFDTPAVLESLLPHKDVLPPILSFQNGVENEPLLASRLGSDRVIPGTVTTAVGRNGPGDIVVEKLRGIGVSTLHPLGPALVKVMNTAGLRARPYPNPAAMKWSKMLTNLLANATSAILDMTPAQIFASPALFKVEMRMLRETLRVMQAQNIPVVDLPATPVRALAWAVTSMPLAIARPVLARAVGGGRGAKMPSFHIDLHQGRGKSEVDYLNGAVARYGKKHHTPAPVNQILTQILLDLTEGRTPLDAYAHNPEKLLAKIPGE